MSDEALVLRAFRFASVMFASFCPGAPAALDRILAELALLRAEHEAVVEYLRHPYYDAGLKAYSALVATNVTAEEWRKAHE
jgi:hypothetical protein